VNFRRVFEVPGVERFALTEISSEMKVSIDYVCVSRIVSFRFVSNSIFIAHLNTPQGDSVGIVPQYLV